MVGVHLKACPTKRCEHNYNLHCWQCVDDVFSVVSVELHCAWCQAIFYDCV